MRSFREFLDRLEEARAENKKWSTKDAKSLHPGDQLKEAPEVSTKGETITVKGSDGKSRSFRKGQTIRFKHQDKMMFAKVTGKASRGGYSYVKVEGPDNYGYHVIPSNIQ